MLLDPHAAAEEGGIRAGRFECGEKMRCALRIRSVIESDGDDTLVVAIRVDASKDR
jgi:hypothetical protein